MLKEDKKEALLKDVLKRIILKLYRLIDTRLIKAWAGKTRERYFLKTNSKLKTNLLIVIF